MEVAFRRAMKIAMFARNAATARGIFINEIAKPERAANSALWITF